MGKGSLESCLMRFLIKYRMSFVASTGMSPAEILMERLSSHLSIAHPGLEEIGKKGEGENRSNAENMEEVA